MLLETAPIMFFGGKGGVGKTTLATATAFMLSQDHNVLLVSTDPAHNLGHIFATTLSDTPTHLTPSLSAIELDPARATEEHLDTVGASMRRFMPEHLHGEVQKHLDLARQSPGTQEAALLERMASLVARSNEYDYLVFDTAPSGHTSRLMALPEIMAAYTEGLLARREKSDKFGSLVRGMSGGSGVANDPVERRNQEIRATLFQRRERFEHLRAALTSQRTVFHIVLTAERLPVLESAEFHAELTAHGVRVGSMLVNRRTPAGQGEFLASRRAAEDEALVLLHDKLPNTPVHEVPWLPEEVASPAGVARLAQYLGQDGELTRASASGADVGLGH